MDVSNPVGAFRPLSGACVFNLVKSSSYKILKVSDGVVLFAKVGIVPSPSPAGMEISIAPTAFEDPRGFERYPDWVAAAERGVRYALAHSIPPQTEGMRLLVTSILGTEVDTTADAVAAAACLATWDALEAVGTHPPRFEGRKIIFEY